MEEARFDTETPGLLTVVQPGQALPPARGTMWPALFTNTLCAARSRVKSGLLHLPTEAGVPAACRASCGPIRRDNVCLLVTPFVSKVKSRCLSSWPEPKPVLPTSFSPSCSAGSLLASSAVAHSYSTRLCATGPLPLLSPPPRILFPTGWDW